MESPTKPRTSKESSQSILSKPNAYFLTEPLLQTRLDSSGIVSILKSTYIGLPILKV